MSAVEEIDQERRITFCLYEYWEKLAGERRLPALKDMSRDKIDPFKKNLVLLDLRSDPDQPHFQVIGQDLQEDLEEDLAGKPVSSVPRRTMLSRVTDHYLEVLANRVPIAFEAEFVNIDGEKALYRGILLPFSDDNDNINFILGGVRWLLEKDVTLDDTKPTIEELMRNISVGRDVDSTEIEQASDETEDLAQAEDDPDDLAQSDLAQAEDDIEQRADEEDDVLEVETDETEELETTQDEDALRKDEVVAEEDDDLGVETDETEQLDAGSDEIILSEDDFVAEENDDFSTQSNETEEIELTSDQHVPSEDGLVTEEPGGAANEPGGSDELEMVVDEDEPYDDTPGLTRKEFVPHEDAVTEEVLADADDDISEMSGDDPVDFDALVEEEEASIVDVLETGDESSASLDDVEISMEAEEPDGDTEDISGSLVEMLEDEDAPKTEQSDPGEQIASEEFSAEDEADIEAADAVPIDSTEEMPSADSDEEMDVVLVEDAFSDAEEDEQYLEFEETPSFEDQIVDELSAGDAGVQQDDSIELEDIALDDAEKVQENEPEAAQEASPDSPAEGPLSLDQEPDSEDLSIEDLMQSIISERKFDLAYERERKFHEKIAKQESDTEEYPETNNIPEDVLERVPEDLMDEPPLDLVDETAEDVIKELVAETSEDIIEPAEEKAEEISAEPVVEAAIIEPEPQEDETGELEEPPTPDPGDETTDDVIEDLVEDTTEDIFEPSEDTAEEISAEPAVAEDIIEPEPVTNIEPEQPPTTELEEVAETAAAQVSEAPQEKPKKISVIERAMEMMSPNFNRKKDVPTEEPLVTGSVELVEDEIVEDEITEDEITEDEITEDEITEDEITEDEITENEIAEDEIAEDEIIELEPVEQAVSEQDPISEDDDSAALEDLILEDAPIEDDIILEEVPVEEQVVLEEVPETAEPEEAVAEVSQHPDQPDAEISDQGMSTEELRRTLKQIVGYINKEDANHNRSRDSLYNILTAIYEFHDTCEKSPVAYGEIVEDHKLKVQSRAPFTPVLKICLGKDYDKTRLTEYAAALGIARYMNVDISEFHAFIKNFPGGIKGCVKEMRIIRKHGASGNITARKTRSVEEAREILREMAPIASFRLKKVIVGNNVDEFCLLLAKRDGHDINVLKILDDKYSKIDPILKRAAFIKGNLNDRK